MITNVLPPFLWFTVYNRIKQHNKQACIMLPDTGIAPNMKLAINSLPTKFFPDTSLTFGQFPDISLTATKFPDISSFFMFRQQVITLYSG